MPGNPQASVYIGNLDEKVDEKVIYEIMIQAGPLVDLHMPRDKETKRHKGYAFAEYTTEKSALYAVSLFSGLVFLHKKLLRFSISGQDKVAQTPPQEAREIKLDNTDNQYSQRLPIPVQSPPVGYCNSPVGSLSGNSTALLSGHPSAFAQSRLPGVGHGLEVFPLAHPHSYNAHVGAMHSSYYGIGQRLDFSPLARAQDYNAHLVSLGQAGLRSSFPSIDQSIVYRSR